MTLRFDNDHRFGIFTPEEEEATNAAIAQAEARVRQMEREAGPGGWLFPTELQRTAQAARATLTAIIGVRDGVRASPDYDHETAIQIVDNASQLNPDLVRGAVIGQTVGDRIPMSITSILSDLKWIIGGALALYLAVMFIPRRK